MAFPVTAAQGKGATARLQPGSPRVAQRAQLQRGRPERVSVLGHGPGHRVHHLPKGGLRVRRQGVGLGRVSGQVEEQRWLVMGDLVPGAGADRLPVAGARPAWLEQRRRVVDFP